MRSLSAILGLPSRWWVPARHDQAAATASPQNYLASKQRPYTLPCVYYLKCGGAVQDGVWASGSLGGFLTGEGMVSAL